CTMHPSNLARAGRPFPLALCRALVLTALHGNSRPAHRSRSWYSRADSIAISFRRRREELAAQACRGAHDSLGGGCVGNVYTPGSTYAVESHHGRVEQ